LVVAIGPWEGFSTCKFQSLGNDGIGQFNFGTYRITTHHQVRRKCLKQGNGAFGRKILFNILLLSKKSWAAYQSSKKKKCDFFHK
jgi:hypothetical protein